MELLYLAIGVILGISLKNKQLPTKEEINIIKSKGLKEKAQFFEPISDPEKKENERAYNEVKAWFLGNKKWQRNFK